MQHTFGADSVTITQGSSQDIEILLRYSSGRTFDLTDVTEIKAIFPGSPLVEITLSDDEIEVVEPKTDGALVLSLSSAKTSLLNSDERLTFEIELTSPGKTHVVQFKEMLDVNKRLA